MPSTLWSRIAGTPLAIVLFLVAMAVIAGQLAAMASVVQGQVHRAQARESARSAIGSALNQCSRTDEGRIDDGCKTRVYLSAGL